MPDNTLVSSDYLSKEYDCEIYLKPEWYGPTKSHKDKWAKAAVDLAKQNGAERVVVMSSGNQGLAVAFACQQEGIQCKIFAEPGIAEQYLELYRKYGASAEVAVDVEEQHRMFEACVEEGYFPLGVTHKQRDAGEDLPAVDAYRQTTQEIMNALGRCPDVVVFPTSYADHAEGALREFIDLKHAGKIDELPKFILARTDFVTGQRAHSIATDLTTKYVEHIIIDGGGHNVFVTDDQMQIAQDAILSNHGWKIELSSAAGVAALEKLDKNLLEKKTVVVVLTASEDK